TLQVGMTSTPQPTHDAGFHHSPRTDFRPLLPLRRFNHFCAVRCPSYPSLARRRTRSIRASARVRPELVLVPARAGAEAGRNLGRGQEWVETSGGGGRSGLKAGGCGGRTMSGWLDSHLV